ncbi:MAG TPA: hypothetical protein DEO49_08420 [Sutterella sp.]|nr:hypothetical protein [Sutterella sp.]
MKPIHDSACVQRTLDFFREPELGACRKAAPKQPEGAAAAMAALVPEPAFSIAADHLAHEAQASLPPCARRAFCIADARRALEARAHS